ncbi:SAM-dependent methyltransferase [Micromonospora sp. R77]|uniref:SAM-dependent methyltransferase n=1 Tax=Micromonospora sp. R77 TaxID=2925836 RepID=UPI001F61F9D0|nr:SAM-dependent methyltransferase [Micromonospora sp. R77]MCI4065986.1 SAM-dependent methyltransferase [Micromonospora sp. R77]
MERPGWAPPGVDITTPTSSRIYDYMLGGSHNFAADRAVAEQAIAAMPHLPAVLRENRRFLGRAVRHLAGEAGIDQFLDLGSGIPTAGNVHEITAGINPEARVVHVDIDPVAVAHSQAILTGHPYAAAVAGDLRRVGDVLAHPVVADLLDLDRPVAVLLVAALHFVPDDATAGAVLADLRDALAPGSHVAVSHASDDGRPPAGLRDAQSIYARADSAVTMRSRETLDAMLRGWELVPPGIVACPAWRPEPDDPPSAHFPGYGLVARLPHPA